MYDHSRDAAIAGYPCAVVRKAGNPGAAGAGLARIREAGAGK
jgi:hypothetical protein